VQVLQVFAEVGGRKLLFVFPLTNAQLDLKTKSANVKHSTLEECRFWRSLSLGSESGQNKAPKLNSPHPTPPQPHPPGVELGSFVLTALASQ